MKQYPLAFGIVLIAISSIVLCSADCNSGIWTPGATQDGFGVTMYDNVADNAITVSSGGVYSNQHGSPSSITARWNMVVVVTSIYRIQDTATGLYIRSTGTSSVIGSTTLASDTGTSWTITETSSGSGVWYITNTVNGYRLDIIDLIMASPSSGPSYTTYAGTYFTQNGCTCNSICTDNAQATCVNDVCTLPLLSSSAPSMIPSSSAPSILPSSSASQMPPSSSASNLPSSSSSVGLLSSSANVGLLSSSAASIQSSSSIGMISSSSTPSLPLSSSSAPVIVMSSSAASTQPSSSSSSISIESSSTSPVSLLSSSSDDIGSSARSSSSSSTGGGPRSSSSSSTGGTNHSSNITLSSSSTGVICLVNCTVVDEPVNVGEMTTATIIIFAAGGTVVVLIGVWYFMNPVTLIAPSSMATASTSLPLTSVGVPVSGNVLDAMTKAMELHKHSKAATAVKTNGHYHPSSPVSEYSSNYPLMHQSRTHS